MPIEMPAEQASLGEPAVAAAVFGEHFARLNRYVEWLAGAGIERGLIGPRERPRLWDRHVINCAAASGLIPVERRVVDVGSGAGLPGIVLAVMRPDLRLVLVDATVRRTTFLHQVVDDLELTDRVRVVNGRLEDDEVRAQLGRSEVVTARAVAPLGRLAGWCLPLLRSGGTVLAIKGQSAAAEVQAARPQLRRMGVVVADIHQLPFGGQTTVVVELRHDVSRETRRRRA